MHWQVTLRTKEIKNSCQGPKRAFNSSLIIVFVSRYTSRILKLKHDSSVPAQVSCPWCAHSPVEVPRQPEGNGAPDRPALRAQRPVSTARTRRERGTPIPASLSSGGSERPAPSLPSGARPGPRLWATDGPGRRPQQTRQTDIDTETRADRRRHTETHRAAAPALSHQGLRHPGPGPARAPPAPPSNLARLSRRARADGRREAAPRPRPPCPVPLVGGRRTPGMAAHLGARGCCACAEAAAVPPPPLSCPPFSEGTGGGCFPSFYFARGKRQFKSSGFQTL